MEGLSSDWVLSICSILSSTAHSYNAYLGDYTYIIMAGAYYSYRSEDPYSTNLTYKIIPSSTLLEQRAKKGALRE